MRSLFEVRTLTLELGISTSQDATRAAAGRGGLGATPREDTLEVTAQLSQMLCSPVAAQLGQKRLLILPLKRNIITI